MVGAVLSQAYERKLPVVEANTKRVLCRLFGHEADLDSPATQRWLWKTAETMLPSRRVGDFNQALMELGALVCTVRNPTCANCPFKRECKAFQSGTQEEIPARRVRPETVHVREVCVIFRHANRVLLTQRPSTGRWANMWEFPRIVLNRRESVAAGARRLSVSLGLAAQLGEVLATIRYTVTRFRMSMTCLNATASDTAFVSEYYEGGRWLRLSELSNYPVSSPQRKLASTLGRQQVQ
jgi:A/G-specific adenine glycosylase